MRLGQSVFWLLAFITTIHALALPAAFQDFADSSKELFKRKGGGGGRGGGGGFSSGGGSRSGGSSSSSGSSRGSSGSSSSGLRSSSSNRGGTTKGGSGVRPTYAGGRYYGGGATRPYRSGTKSPGGVAPYLLGGAALGVFPGLWLYGAYAYNYPGRYTYYNQTANENNTRPVQCLCAQYQECGCAGQNDSDYLTSVANNNTIARVADVNGTDTLVVNGTLANGTTASSAAPGSLKMQGVAETSGWWVMVAIAGYAAWLL